MRRAEYIKTLLEDKGVDGDRLIIEDAMDKKSSEYINESDDDTLKAAKNRRTTFKVI